MQNRLPRTVRFAASLLLISIVLFLSAGFSSAQSSKTDVVLVDEMLVWSDLGREIEDELEDGVSDPDLRAKYISELSEWRRRFDYTVEWWGEPVDSLLARLDVLGEVPEGGEPPEIAERRDELEADLRRAISRLRRAEEASAHASSLIGKLEKVEREDRRSNIFDPGPSPLSLGTIGAAVEDISGFPAGARSASGSGSEGGSGESRWKAGLIPLLSGLLVFVGGGALVRRLLRRRQADSATGDVEPEVAAVFAVLEFAIPMAGLALAIGSFTWSTLPGAGTEAMTAALWKAGMVLVAARWLASYALPGTATFELLGLDDAKRDKIAKSLSFLGVPVAVIYLQQPVRAALEPSPETLAVLGFLVLLAISIPLFVIGNALVFARAQETEATEHPGPGRLESEFAAKVTRRIGYILIACSGLGPLLAAFGYQELAFYFAWEPAFTTWLLAAIYLLQSLSDRFFRSVSAPDVDGADTLAAAISRIVISLLALPSLAAIWGVRASDWSEVWYGISRGISVGELQISPGKVVALFAAFAFGIVVTRFIQGVMKHSLLPRTNVRRGTQAALVTGVGYVGFVIAALLAFAIAGWDLRGIAVIAGALSVGIGFGLQGLVSNFLSGVILLVERPFVEGDWIEIEGAMGIVKKISARSSTIETFDKTDVVVPNSELVSGKVTNWTQASNAGRLILPIGVGYDSDSERIETILREVAAEHPLVVAHPPPLIVFQGFGDNALEFEVRVILRDINFGLSARTQLNHRILARLREEGVKIPYPQRDVTLTNIDALRSVQDDQAEPEA